MRDMLNRWQLIPFSVRSDPATRKPIRRAGWPVSAGKAGPWGAYVRVGERLMGLAVRRRPIL